MLTAFLLLQTLCVTVEAKEAPEKPQFERMEPAGTEIVHNEAPLQTYTFGEYQELALLITDYHELWAYSLNLEAQIASLERELHSSNGKAELWKTATNNEKKHALFWKAAYKEERNLRLKTESGVRKTKWVPWAVVVAQSVAMAVVASTN